MSTAPIAKTTASRPYSLGAWSIPHIAETNAPTTHTSKIAASASFSRVIPPPMPLLTSIIAVSREQDKNAPPRIPERHVARLNNDVSFRRYPIRKIVNAMTTIRMSPIIPGTIHGGAGLRC